MPTQRARQIVLGMATLTLLLAAGGRVHADTILYNNLGAASDGSDPIATNPFGPLFDSFSTGATPVNLTDVKVLLSGSPSSATITVALLSDSSTSPGAVLDVIGTLSDNALSGTPTVFDFPVVPSFPLAANTRYWIELSSPDSTAEWSYSLDTSGPGVSGEFFGHQDQVFPNEEGPYQMEVTAETAAPAPAAVPEPSSLALCALGGLALAGWRRWKGRRQR